MNYQIAYENACHELTGLRQAYNGAAGALAPVVAERDRLASELDALTAELAEARQTIEDLALGSSTACGTTRHISPHDLPLGQPKL